MEIPDELIAALEQVPNFKEVSDFLGDENVTLGLSYMAKFAVNPDIEDKSLVRLIPQLQAVAGICGVNAKAYQTIKKQAPDAAHKKNLYYTLSEEFDKLVMALKKRV